MKAVLLALLLLPSLSLNAQTVFYQDNPNKPIIAVACSSERRTAEDDMILATLVDSINTLGTYEGVLTDIIFKEGIPPKADDFNNTKIRAAPLYVLTGSRAVNISTNEYIVSLWKVKDGSLAGSNRISYTDPTQVGSVAQLLVAQLIYLVPPPQILPPLDDAIWKDGYMFIGLGGGGVFRRYNGTDGFAYDGLSYTLSAFIDYQALFFQEIDLGLSVGLETTFTSTFLFYRRYIDDDISNDTENVFYSSYLLENALLFKINYYPGVMLLSLRGGIYNKFALYGEKADDSVAFPFGWIGGLEVGVKAWNGIVSLVIDFRGDLTSGRFNPGRWGWDELATDLSPEVRNLTFQRFSVTFGAAYKFTLLTRPHKQAIAYEGGW